MKAFRHVHFEEHVKGTANHNNHEAHIKVNTVDVNDHEDYSNNADRLSDMGSTKSMSFASILQDKSPKKTVKISELHNDEIFEGTDLAIPLVAIEKVSIRFVNTLYGYFIGKRLAFPIVENYVKNTCAKFSLERVMLQNGFFFFQLSTRDGMEKVIENGSWLILFVPLILNVWTPHSKLKKDEIISAPVWIKLHNIPIVAYSTSLSLITTKVEGLIMLDSYISNMCLKSRGRNTYARALIEVSSVNALLESLIVAIPLANEMGHTISVGENNEAWTDTNTFVSTINESDSEEVEEVLVEEDTGSNKGRTKKTNGNKGQALPLSSVLKADKKELFCSFVYAHNRYIHRHALWHNLCLHKHYIRGRPWCLLGDFNAALNLEDKLVGSSNIDIVMRDFKDCVEEIKVSDVNHSVLKFTWNQKPKGEDGFLKKIDKIMVNMEFNYTFIGAHAIF
ncbi:zinc knuckle CX2CX4HX4C containing protein [Tanacetum coccineum]